MGIMSAASKGRADVAAGPSTASSTRGLSAVDNSGSGVSNTVAQGTNKVEDSPFTPWSWTTDEANQYLFSQIESNFAFGEGGILEWSPEEVSHLAGFDAFT